jgi:mRNA-degrading endonuclease RelE of RelBE toxin-antitoxin system
VPYQIDYSPEAEGHLRALTARQRAIVLDTIDEKLADQPGVETRNRKPMRPNPIAPWELRIDNLRVYYDIQETHEVDELPKPRVLILAVGIKDHNRLMIGGKEIEL